MKILILGGTAFLSAATARQAVGRGHQVTCLARGTSSRPPEGTAWVHADRDLGIDAYAGVAGEWDAVIDVSRQPGQVRDALQTLGERAGLWTFVSTVSVYTDDATPGQDESAALHPPLQADTYTDPEQYGPAKVACEAAVIESVGDRAHISRAGLIVGPGDVSDRFGYWPARFARGGRVLVPDTPDALTQVIDVDDLAGWLLDSAENRTAGILNAVGDPLPLSQLLDMVAQVAGDHDQQVRIDPAFLVEHGVEYWAGPRSLPLWLPAEYRGFGCRSNAAAGAAGMQLRPLVETAQRSLSYERQLGLDRDRRAGLSVDDELELLSEWSKRS
ncbi:epimerase [Microlunatus elymi]|uniref:Epimerase n=1 Tax=Microlunatus elymi TaxID=2596828 RepID=A0A516PZD8_9ACTN|nr:epimerase [Microlunatus elymi]QDP96351.1 epimerase [Microlunatus elymi]